MSVPLHMDCSAAAAAAAILDLHLDREPLRGKDEAPSRGDQVAIEGRMAYPLSMTRAATSSVEQKTDVSKGH